MTAETCHVAWCENVPEHNGPHRNTLLNLTARDVTSWQPTAVQLRLQGESARVRALALVVANCEVGLTWSQARQLHNTLDDAERRYGQTT